MFDVQAIAETSRAVREFNPLIHCMTNHVTVNDCANVLLAAGGSPCMAEEVEIAQETAAISAGINLNIGTLHNRMLDSMIIASHQANEMGIPVTLDPVGVGASKLRSSAAAKLLDEVKFAAIRGNMSEVKALATGSSGTKGVDVAASDAITEENYRALGQALREYAQKLGTVVVASGPIDLATDGETIYAVHNGTPMMGTITGSGCMLTTLMCGWLAANHKRERPRSALEVAVGTVCAFGVCGEIATEKTREKNAGIGTFRVELLDAITVAPVETLCECAKVETIN
ncbi:MAG: hydroxyethylthiazole kinase [Thermoguttaceae bacterium]